MTTQQNEAEVTDLIEAVYESKDIFFQQLLEETGSDDESSSLLFLSVSTIFGTEMANWLAKSLKEGLQDEDTQKTVIIGGAAAGAAFGSVFAPIIGSAIGAVIGGISGYLSPNMFAPVENEDLKTKESMDKALRYASDEYERLSYMRELEELTEDAFKNEISDLYIHARDTIKKILHPEQNEHS